MGPNDHTVFAGKNEAKASAITGVGGGTAATPNAFTAWSTGPEPKNGPRAVDMAKSDEPEQACPHCSYKTRLKDDFAYHAKKINGLTKCQRQRQAYESLKDCSACKGQGETANAGVCQVCMGSGRVRDESKSAAPIDMDELAGKIAEKVSNALNPAFLAIADALKGFNPKVTSAAKEKKQPRKGKARGSSRVDRRGTPAAGSPPVAPVERQDQPMADPPAGPEAAE